ncbi:MAG: hypothetical protein HY694_04220 [Deltaproteobacteria bacterium]|nr:hypothetical protein [Deltaproteobacteria bacterium]
MFKAAITSGGILNGTLDETRAVGIPGETLGEETLDEISEDEMPGENHHRETPNGTSGENILDDEIRRGEIPGDHESRGSHGESLMLMPVPHPLGVFRQAIHRSQILSTMVCS